MNSRTFYPGYKKHLDSENTAAEEANHEAFEMDREDIRHMLIAEKAQIIRDDYYKFTPRVGYEAQMRIYKLLHPLTNFLRLIIILDIFFSPPTWCELLGENIDNACRFKDDGTSVLRSPMPIVHTMVFSIGTPLSVVFLTVVRTWKYSLIRRNWNEMYVCIA